MRNEATQWKQRTGVEAKIGHVVVVVRPRVPQSTEASKEEKRRHRRDQGRDRVPGKWSADRRERNQRDQQHHPGLALD